MILDSCFLIDVMTAEEAAVAKLEELEAGARPVAVATPSITEVERGMDRPSVEAFEGVLERISVVPFDHATARTAAAVLRRLDENGTPISAMDAMIAASALERDEPVVTRNVSEFRRVERLNVTPY